VNIRVVSRRVLSLLAAGLFVLGARADGKPPGVVPDGTVTAPSLSIPYSRFASPQARAFFPKMLAAQAKAPPLDAPIEESITGTRDMAMSSVVCSQALLTQAGVEAELHVWEGMWHSFFSDPELPESQQAYRTIVTFFERHLAASPQEEIHP
jgi:acetyl esterase/lipase